jgi:telomerase reverse transcriptase
VQQQGIPQGSVLSTILCSFFYGHMEHTHLGDFASARHSVLLRFVDDYLFVTTSEKRAIAFVETMHRGTPPRRM